MENENKNENKASPAGEEAPRKRKFLLPFVEGISLGVSAAIPGLSAGTIAVAEKCYDPIVEAVAGLRKAFGKSFRTLLPYLLGLLLGALGALLGIQKGYNAAPFSLTGFFAGCVIGSLPVATSELRRGKDFKEKAFHSLSLVLCFLLASGIGILTAFLPGYSVQEALLSRSGWMYPLFLFAGFLGAAACVVPGISGSMSLMVIGVYHPILDTYFTRKPNASGLNLSLYNGQSAFFVGTGVILFLLLALGALLGLYFSSLWMRNLLRNHRVTTFYGILGLILGSTVSMFLNSSIYPLYPTMKTWDLLLGSVLFFLGALLVFLLVRYVGKPKKGA